MKGLLLSLLWENILFDLIFVIKFKMDVAGVAIATIISQGVSAVLVVWWFIHNKNSFVNFRFSKLKFSKNEFFEILRIGLPAGLQGLAFSFPNVLIQSSLYTISSTNIAGHLINQDEIVAGGASGSSQIENYIFAMIDSFAVGCVSITGQNYGAGKVKNIKKGFLFCFIWMTIFWAFCQVIVVMFPNELLSIFITESDGLNIENALLAGNAKLMLLSFTYILDGLMDLSGCYLRGMKKSTIPAIVTIIGCTGTRIVFLLTLFKMEYFHTITWLYAAFPISWILVILAYIPIITIVQKKVFKNLESTVSYAN